MISDALGIGENGKRPGAVLLIVNQLRRLGKGNHDDTDTAPVEFCFMIFHLAEMSLAGQSSKVSKKDQQEVILKVLTQFSGMAPEIQDGELIDGVLFHGSTSRTWRNKKGALRPSAPFLLTSQKSKTTSDCVRRHRHRRHHGVHRHGHRNRLSVFLAGEPRSP
jgi:hypothetical protein